MNASETAARLAPLARRLLDDDYVQEQIAETIGNLRSARRRARGTGATDAVADRRTRRHLVDAATAATNAGRALSAPEPPRHRGMKRIAVIAILGGAALLVARQRRPAERV
jgi:hypothetical protein